MNIAQQYYSNYDCKPYYDFYQLAGKKGALCAIDEDGCGGIPFNPQFRSMVLIFLEDCNVRLNNANITDD